MKFRALASSSAGNAYLVSDDLTCILIECGLAYRTLQQKMGFSVCELDAVLVSHEHRDHSRCAGEIVRNGQTVYMSVGTALALGLAEEQETEDGRIMIVGTPCVEFLEHRRQVNVGTMMVVPFKIYHDAAEPLGFLVQSREDGEILVFATDTVNLRYRFPPAQIYALEANYNEAILERCERMPDKTKARIRNTHMEIETLCDILKGMDLSLCRRIVLLHLSSATSHEGYFINKVRHVVPDGVKITAAGR